MKIIKLLLFAYFILPASQLLAQTSKGVIPFYFVSEIVIDSKGNLFVTGGNNKIIKFTPDGKGLDFAGSPRGYTGVKDGKGTEAMFAATRFICRRLYLDKKSYPRWLCYYDLWKFQ